MWSRGLPIFAGTSRIFSSRTSLPVLYARPLLCKSEGLVPSLWRGGFGKLARTMGVGVTAVLEPEPEPVINISTAAQIATSSLTKRKPEKKVGTHNGTFHCDEALGCFMIGLTDKFAGAEIVRTRDQRILDTMDAVLDVGGVYDAERDRFDHHQRGFGHVFGHGFLTKLSSAGLVYKHYGEEIIAKELGKDPHDGDVQRVYVAVYKSFLEAIDGIDNGVNQYDSDLPPKYVEGTNLSARVGRLNPDWMEEQSPEKEDAAFREAMSLTGREFLHFVHYYGKSWLPARSIVSESLVARHDVHESGEVMILKQFCPWKQHLSEIEEELQLDATIKYVVYQDDRSGQWRVQAVAVAPGKFESRKPLPSRWRGLRDDVLSRETGIDGCVFVHMSGFIGGANTFEGTLELAIRALSVVEERTL